MSFLKLTSVEKTEADKKILDNINWEINGNENWIVFGPNGSGKSSLLNIASMNLHPSKGEVELLGNFLGKSDLRRLKSRIGFMSKTLENRFRANIKTLEVVVTALTGATEPWWDTFTSSDWSRAHGLLDLMGCGDKSDQTFGSLSTGERQRAMIARALMPEPEILFLDEPTAGLDMKGREELLTALSNLVNEETSPPMVLVTHHLEEIPSDFSHILLLREGKIVDSGMINEVLTKENILECFELEVSIKKTLGRWSIQTPERKNV
tara:strand:- start:671 stop:1465 length:795 start_codon:yes stop_codon:yes gene_type:complete